MLNWETTTDDMLEKIEEKDEQIRKLEERILALEADKKEAWKIVYAKNKEVKKLKEQVEHEKSENTDAKVELTAKELLLGNIQVFIVFYFNVKIFS